MLARRQKTAATRCTNSKVRSYVTRTYTSQHFERWQSEWSIYWDVFEL